jgi:hypothetical protein
MFPVTRRVQAIKDAVMTMDTLASKSRTRQAPRLRPDADVIRKIRAEIDRLSNSKKSSTQRFMLRMLATYPKVRA